MGSVGQDFKSYLESRNDLTEAEQDMLAANDFDRMRSITSEQTSTTTPVTKQQVNSLENSVRKANTEQELNDCENTANRLLAGDVQDSVLVDRLSYIKSVINRRRLEIRKGVQ